MGTILTYTGRSVDPTNLRPEDLAIEDIAHALSQICRFTGHTRSIYTVGHHSLLASYLVRDAETHALAALLHDASEAYLCDVAGPVKQLAVMAGYRMLEATVQRVIQDTFRVRFDVPAVEAVDRYLLRVELAQLLPVAPSPDPPPFTITLLPPETVEALFLMRFHRLTRTPEAWDVSA